MVGENLETECDVRPKVQALCGIDDAVIHAFFCFRKGFRMWCCARANHDGGMHFRFFFP